MLLFGYKYLDCIQEALKESIRPGERRDCQRLERCDPFSTSMLVPIARYIWILSSQLEGKAMSLFMYQFKYTPSAWAAFVKKPEDRGALVDALLKILGGRLVSVFYSFGEWNGLVIFEAPDGNKALAAIVNIISPGQLEATKTTVLLTIEDVIKAMPLSSTLAFRGIEPVVPALAV
jgi:uncharacterized protein with GYD domain